MNSQNVTNRGDLGRVGSLKVRTFYRNYASVLFSRYIELFVDSNVANLSHPMCIWRPC